MTSLFWWRERAGGSGSWFTEWKASEWWRNINAGRYRWAKQPPASSVTCGVCFRSQKEAVPNSYQPAECLKVIQEKKVRNPQSSLPTQRRVRPWKHAVYGQHLQHLCVWLFVLLNDFIAYCVCSMCTNHVLIPEIIRHKMCCNLFLFVCFLVFARNCPISIRIISVQNRSC